MRSVRAYRLDCGVLLVWLICPTLASATPADPTVEEITTVWRDRQEKAKRVRIEWRLKHTTPKGSQDFIAKAIPGIKPGPHPPSDLQLPGTGEMVLDGPSYRLGLKYEEWSMERAAAQPLALIYTWDGQTYLRQQGDAAPKGNSTAHYKPTPGDRTELQELALRPLLRACRGTDEKCLADTLDRYEPTGRRITVRGRPCVELARTRRAADQKHFLLVDAERHVVVREGLARGNSGGYQVDVEYVPHPGVGWRPHRWDTVMSSGNGTLMESNTNEVTRFEADIDIPPSVFRPTLEVGTWVFDTRDDGPEVQYVIRADGTKSGAIPSDERPQYEDMVNAQDAPAGRFSTFVIAGLAVVASVLALILGRLLWMRHAHRRRLPGQFQRGGLS